MFSTCWQSDLRRALQRAQPSERSVKVAVVGIGHELRGDDAVGVHVARGLKHRSLPATWLAVDAGPVPESCTGLLRRFQPDLVALVDATPSESAPGSVRWLESWDGDAPGFSTHSLSLNVLARYLCGELNCSVGLLSVQPASYTLAAPLSPAVREAASGIIDGLAWLAGIPRLKE